MNLDTPSQQDLVVAILQAFLYALYLVSLAHALRWLLYYEEGWTLRSRDQVNWALLTTTFVVFILTTVDLAFRITASRLPFASGKVTHLKMTIAGISIEGSTLVLADATLPTDHPLLVGIPKVVVRRLLSSGSMAWKYHIFGALDR
ncbi:hypothetical protein JOM56_004654 [Amanita muscaria]